MLEPVNQERMEAEGAINLFLRLFPLLAAHFQLNDDLVNDVTGLDLGFLRQATVRRLAEDYEEALEDEKQGDKGFVEALPSVVLNPAIKRPILDD